MLIRFVGGPWHNRLYGIEGGDLAGCVYVVDQPYRLCKFVTKGGTEYMQYIHGSLIYGDVEPVTVHEQCYRERFKPWKINSREVYFRFRKVCQ